VKQKVKAKATFACGFCLDMKLMSTVLPTIKHLWRVSKGVDKLR